MTHAAKKSAAVLDRVDFTLEADAHAYADAERKKGRGTAVEFKEWTNLKVWRVTVYAPPRAARS